MANPSDLFDQDLLDTSDQATNFGNWVNYNQPADPSYYQQYEEPMWDECDPTLPTNGNFPEGLQLNTGTKVRCHVSLHALTVFRCI